MASPAGQVGSLVRYGQRRGRRPPGSLQITFRRQRGPARMADRHARGEPRHTPPWPNRRHVTAAWREAARNGHRLLLFRTSGGWHELGPSPVRALESTTVHTSVPSSARTDGTSSLLTGSSVSLRPRRSRLPLSRRNRRDRRQTSLAALAPCEGRNDSCYYRGL